MSKKFTKEELEQDPLLDFYVKTVSFYKSNRTTVLSAIGVVLLILAASIGFYFYNTSQEERAQNLLAIAEVSYSQGDYIVALNGDEYTLSYGLVQIANEFPGTNAANIANYYAAVSYFKLGDHENALAYIEEFEPAEGIMGVGAVSFHAAMLKVNGMAEAAAKKYEQAAHWDENSSTTPYNLYKAAEIYYELGQIEKASTLAEQIIEEYPDSPEFAKSQRLQGRIAVAG